MSLLTLSNPSASNVWNVVLDKHPEVENDLPLTFFNIKNGSSLTLIVYLNGSRAGIVEAYSMDTYIGKQFETFTVTTKDGNNLAIEDVFVQVGNNIQMTTSPYNPSWEMLEENIDVYASGCNARVSYSSTTTPENIKYSINIQNSLIVQRRLDVQGSADYGTYEIIFDIDNETVLAGSTPINGVVLDTKQYKKTIINSGFDFSLTDCSIKGWMIDYLNITMDKDKTTDATIEVDPGNGENAYDDNPDSITTLSVTTAEITAIELSFPETNISKLHVCYDQYGDGAGGYSYLDIQLKENGSWITCKSNTQGPSNFDTYIMHHILDLTSEKVTGIRFRHSGNIQSRVGIRDITLLS